MKFNKKTKSAIYQECRKRVGGFGMWLEIQERITFKNDEYYTNRLRSGDNDSDLYDFIHWNDFCDTDFEMINGHTLLDIPVHDTEQLLENLMVLINNKGELIRSFTTFELIQKETQEFLKNYEE